ncbi:hypothetical protein [Chitinilyticum piscinae]|uniref:hypothetical protein n=1 Tax=Chitinilyticum piscinae TaxID=2866724 RepID=UPI001880DC79|nr:hypothetical protein [Chitinilyticum piscinae]
MAFFIGNENCEKRNPRGIALGVAVVDKTGDILIWVFVVAALTIDWFCVYYKTTTYRLGAQNCRAGC